MQFTMHAHTQSSHIFIVKKLKTKGVSTCVRLFIFERRVAQVISLERAPRDASNDMSHVFLRQIHLELFNFGLPQTNNVMIHSFVCRLYFTCKLTFVR